MRSSSESSSIRPCGHARLRRLQVAGGDQLGVDEVLDRAAGEIPNVVARKNHGLSVRIAHGTAAVYTIAASQQAMALQASRGVSLTPVRAGLGVEARVGDPQPLHRPATHQVLVDDLRGIFRLHIAIPDGFGIDDDRGPVLALVKAAGLVDAHRAAQPASFVSCCNCVCSSLLPSVVQEGRGASAGRTLWQTKT